MTSGQQGVRPQEPSTLGPPPAAYLATLVVYIALGFVLRSVVLNWIVGPLFLLAALHLLPRLVRPAASNDAG